MESSTPVSAITVTNLVFKGETEAQMGKVIFLGHRGWQGWCEKPGLMASNPETENAASPNYSVCFAQTDSLLIRELMVIEI